MMQEGTNLEEVPEASKTPNQLDILGALAATEGARNLLEIDKVLNEIDDSIIFVDKSFKSLVATMGRGEDYASGFGKVLEATAKEIILAGGKRQDAIDIQNETLNIMGRASMLSQKQAVDLFNASKVTGVASKDLTTAFLDSGRNLSNISKEMMTVRETAQSLGVNAKQVSSLVVANLDKLNRYTFRGGVEGLAKMAANAQSMRVGMESTFDLVDDLMNPETAIEMASEFQRMGVASADLTNPLKLMSMEAGELQEKIGEAMSKYVTIGEDGTKTISQQGVRVMKQLANTGVLTRGELEKLAIGTREMQDKMSKISFAGLNLDEDTQKLIANVAQLGKGGVYEIQTTDKNNQIVSKSIEQFVQDLGGDQEKIREALLSQEQKTGDASADMGAIAKGQLDVLTQIKQQNEALLASVGFTVSAGKIGPELLKASAELNKFINTPLFKQVGSESKIGKSLDTTGEEIKNALQEFKSGKLDQAGLMKLIQDIGGAGGKLGTTFGEVGVDVANDYFAQLGFGEDVVDEFINGIKEKLPEAQKGGIELTYAILDGLNEALEQMGIKVPDTFKRKKEEETGKTPNPNLPPGEGEVITNPNLPPGEGEVITNSNLPPGTGGDEGLLFLDDLQNLDLQQLTNQLIQPLDRLDITTSEVGTLNVQSLNISGGIELPTVTPTPTNITPEVETKPAVEDNYTKIQELIDKGLVGEAIASTGNGALFNQELPETIPTTEPTINVESALPELVGELPEIKEDKITEPKTGFFEKINNFVQELKTESVKPSSEEIIEPKKPDTGFRFFDQNTFKKETPTPTPTFVESLIPPVEKTEEPKSDLLKGFESSLNKLSELKLPEINLLGKPKTEEPKSDLLKGFEDSAKKMADLKIGGLEKEPKIQLGKSEETGGKKLFDFKPSILGKFISEAKPEEEKEPQEEKKGRFSKIKDAFVKSFIEPKAEEQTFILPEEEQQQTFTLPQEEYTPGEINTEEELSNIDKIAAELGLKQEDLTNIPTQEAQPEIKPETELKIDTSEVGTLNVKNLNIGPELTKLLSTTKEVEEGEPVNVQIQKLIEEGIVGEPTASTANEVLFKQEQPATPEPTTQIDIESALPEVEQELPELPKGETKVGLLDKIKSMGKPVETEEPSAYEGYKKLLEEISGAEIVGQGEEAFFLTPEMIEEGKKASELIGPEKQEPKIPTIQTPSKIEKINEKLFDFKPSILGKYIAEQNEKPIEDLEKIEPIGLEPKSELAPIKPALASLPIPEKEEKQPLGKRLKEGIGELKEKFKGKQEEEKPIAALPETQEEYIIRDKEGKELARSLDRETAERKAGTSEGITVSKETKAITPSAPETPAVGVEKAAAEAEEKTPLKEKLKEGIGNIAEKGKEKFQDVKGKLKDKIEEIGPIGKKIKESLKPKEETTKIEPNKENMFPISKGEFTGSYTKVVDGKMVMKTADEIYLEMEKQKEESSKIQPTTPETPAVGVEKVAAELAPKEESGYLKMLEENDEKAIPFLTSKSGRPVNLDKTDTEKIDVKSIQEVTPKAEDAKSALEKISLTAAEGEEEGIIEPVSEIAEDGTIKLLSGKPGEVKEPEETEREQTLRQAREKQLSFLEELRLKEQTPKTPARGIEKLAEMGQKFGGLFGKKEEESSLANYEPEIPVEEPYIAEGISESATEEYTPSEEEYEPEMVTPSQAIEEVVPSILEPVASPFGLLQDVMGQVGGEQQLTSQGETTQNINIHATIEITGNNEFAKLLDPRQFQQKIESIMTTSIGKTQIAQRFNSATSTEVASMGLNDTKGGRR